VVLHLMLKLVLLLGYERVVCSFSMPASIHAVQHILLCLIWCCAFWGSNGVLAGLLPGHITCLLQQSVM
jgi:hypothetical protein